MIFFCEECKEPHRLSQNALIEFGKLAIRGEAHYVSREKVPGGVATLMKLDCPFNLGIAKTTQSTVYKKVRK